MAEDSRSTVAMRWRAGMQTGRGSRPTVNKHETRGVTPTWSIATAMAARTTASVSSIRRGSALAVHVADDG